VASAGSLVTGVPMVMMDIGTDVSLLLDKPKLLAKLVAVGAVTLNRILLHLIAFPMITGKPRNPNKAATIAAPGSDIGLRACP
jgi:hypothetical protein